MGRKPVLVAALAAALLLSGCSAEPVVDEAANAASACLRVAGTTSAYNKALGAEQTVDEVVQMSVRDVEEFDGADGVIAHDVRGVAQVLIGTGERTVAWRCFSKLTEGKRHSVMLSWV